MKKNVIDLFGNKQLVTIFSNVQGGIKMTNGVSNISVDSQIDYNKVYLIINDESADSAEEPVLKLYIADSDFKTVYPVKA